MIRTAFCHVTHALTACAVVFGGQAQVGPALNAESHGLVLSAGLDLRRFSRGRASERYGYQVCGLPDLDADGVPEVAIAARPGGQGLGSVVGFFEVRSGRSWDVLYRVDGEQAEAGFTGRFDTIGESVIAVGDATGDGVADLFATGGDGMLGTAYLKLISGSDGKTVKRIVGQVFHLASLGDVDGDGNCDVGARRPFQWETGPTRVISGATGEDAGFLPPGIMGRTGDVDGDGQLDFVECRSRFEASAVVSAEMGAPAVPHFVWAKASAGTHYMSKIDIDLDGDGFVDPLQVRYLPGRVADRMPAGEGAFDLFVQSGRANKVLLHRRINGSGGGSLRWIGGLGDLDGDGKAELGVSTSGAFGGKLSIYSGETGAILATALGKNRTFGRSAVNAGDLDGDGLTDLVIGDYENAQAVGGAGAVFVLSVDLKDD